MELAARASPEPSRRPASLVPGLAARVALAGVVGLLIFAIVSGRFFQATGEPRRFGLREAPLAYAHQAARVRGPDGASSNRALVFDLGQAAVYLFHNGPQRKLFMDGRLEVPDRRTFETYVRLETMLNEGRRGWAEPVRRMGDPLILLSHEKDFGAEATLLVDPDWRCIYSTRSPRSSSREIGDGSRTRSPPSTSRLGTSATWNGERYHPIRGESARPGRCSTWARRFGFGMGLPEGSPTRSCSGRRPASPGDRRRSRHRGPSGRRSGCRAGTCSRPDRSAPRTPRALGPCSRHAPGTGHLLLSPRPRAGPSDTVAHSSLLIHSKRAR